ncbi:MAG: transposase [Chloroflexi bacterium]|nr:transposase [Chloroflexota bacterium]MBU1879519.1 transposase [Chloroflexota bacterium]
MAELQRKQAAHRKSLHGQLANHILQLGDVVKAEKLSYKAFQRLFGKSVQFRAPGTFMAVLRCRVKGVGLELDEFPTRTTKLSQVCHNVRRTLPGNCGQVVQKPLSQRWHACDCGVVAQRDLYSAFLATCVEEGADGTSGLNADRARAAWSSADLLLRAALSQIEQPASGERLPSSFGLSGPRQSRSPGAPCNGGIELGHKERR